MTSRTSAWTIGSVIAVLGLSFGVYQYAERQIEQRTEVRIVTGELRETVKELRAQLHAHDQLISDLRVQVADLGQISRYLHGEYRGPGGP